MKNVLYKIDRFFNNHWLIGVLSDTACHTVVPSPRLIPYLKAKNAHQHHILIKPQKTVEAHFLLIDDIRWQTIQSQHQSLNRHWLPGRFVVETSPHNFQVWLRFSNPLSLLQKSVLLQQFHSDPACFPRSRFGRCPGFRNTKSKHRNDAGLFPLAKLVWIDYAHFADLPLPQSNDQFISRKHYDKGNESQTDFAFALALIRKGFSDDCIKKLILDQRSNWDNHLGHVRQLAYLDRTLKNAHLIISG